GWMYHGDLAALIALFLSGRRRRTRLVWGIRCTEVDTRLYGLQLRLVVRACAALSRYPDVITANSEAGLKSHLALGYKPGRRPVLATGSDTEPFKPDPVARATLRRGLGMAADAFVLAHVARVDPMKDHAGMYRALARMPDVVALFVGSGTNSLAAMPNARCLGRRGDVERCFAAADVAVSSSAFGEGFSNPIAQAMAFP